MITCKGVAQLLASDQLDQLSFWKRLSVRFHLWMCRHCSEFASQVDGLTVGARKITASIDDEKTGDQSLEERVLGKLDSR